MNKKVYVNAEVEIVRFETEEVIVASSTDVVVTTSESDPELPTGGNNSTEIL